MAAKKHTKRVALYLRVSTGEQTTDNQRRELAEVATRSGWTIVGAYEDTGISGANGREKRPGFDALCRDAARREFDMIAAWSVDRLGRSLQHLVSFLNELHALGIDLYLHQQAIDTTTPAGRALFQMLGVFSEFERSIIRERVRAGLARARAEGKTLGRPKGRPHRKTKDVLRLRHAGQSVRRIAKRLKMSPNTVHKIVKEAA